MTYVELEIDLQRVHSDAYQVDLRFTDADSGGQDDVGEKPRARGSAPMDPTALLALQQEPAAYGKALASQLFADEAVRALWISAKTVAETHGHSLRVRVRVDPSAAALHALRWELLCDPESGALLATSERTPLSRFMVSPDWRPVKLQPRRDLRALVAVAAPSNLAEYQLADVDLDGEIARATEVLGDLDVEVAGRGQPLTLEHLVACLRPGVDVVYLVCHGALVRGVSRLYLQNDAGEVAVAAGDELARRIAELPTAPRLMVLASCDSALPVPETAPQAAEAALAPLLAAAGVPAILAMQGKISMPTVEKAMPVFFRELLEDGQIDRAMAVARGTVRDRDDSWMPALYLRLKRGRIWYVPGFGGTDEAFLKWKSIISSVRQGTFIPIVGPGGAEHVFGPSGDLAHDLSELHGLPLADYQRRDLAKVAQFLSVDQSPKYARDQIVKHLRQRLLERFPESGSREQSLPKLLDAVVARQEHDDPIGILARLPASVIINANLDPLLLKSLKAEGRDPATLLCNWRPTPDNHPTEPVFVGQPTVEKPILYHCFGVLGKPESLVLTEDDFFDYLIAVAEYKLMPTAVRGQLTRNSLLFLGFRLDLWKFRGLFRQIMALSGKRRLRDFAHVGVQVEPQEDMQVEVSRLREYLEESYRAGDLPPISIYWGTAADFLRELQSHLERAGDSEALSPIEDEDDWIS